MGPIMLAIRFDGQKNAEMVRRTMLEFRPKAGVNRIGTGAGNSGGTRSERGLQGEGEDDA